MYVDTNPDDPAKAAVDPKYTHTFEKADDREKWPFMSKMTATLFQYDIRQLHDVYQRHSCTFDVVGCDAPWGLHKTDYDLEEMRFTHDDYKQFFDAVREIQDPGKKFQYILPCMKEDVSICIYTFCLSVLLTLYPVFRCYNQVHYLTELLPDYGFEQIEQMVWHKPFKSEGPAAAGSSTARHISCYQIILWASNHGEEAHIAFNMDPEESETDMDKLPSHIRKNLISVPNITVCGNLHDRYRSCMYATIYFCYTELPRKGSRRRNLQQISNACSSLLPFAPHHGKAR